MGNCGILALECGLVEKNCEIPCTFVTIKGRLSRYILVIIRKILTIAVLALVSLGAKAQYDVPFSHYWAMEPYYNPGAVGKESKLNLTAAYAMNFVGFEHSPKTMFVSGDMPFFFANTYHGVGLQLLNDQLGAFTHQRLSAQYAYKHKLFGGMISVGLQAGMLMENLDGSKLDFDEKEDELSGSEMKGQSLDLSAGIYYTHGPWYVGVSAQHLTAPLVELGETGELKIDRSYYLTGGYNIRLRSPFLTIHPSVLLMTDGVAYRGDITARLDYKHESRHLYLGAGCSPTNSVTAFVGGVFSGIHVGYSYEFYTNGISIGNGSHELIVGYQTDLNMTKKGKNKHKSVRIL